MLRQSITGQKTELTVRKALEGYGLHVDVPRPDRGVDFVAYSPDAPHRIVRIQVKGRGKTQRNKRYRWFQIRTTKKQRTRTIEKGLPVSEAWREKANLVDFFILVSLRHQETWVLDHQDLETAIACNRIAYGGRKDNIEGIQAELDLDVEDGGVPLRTRLGHCLDNWGIILEALKRPATP